MGFRRGFVRRDSPNSLAALVKIPKAVAKGLRDIYASAGRTVYVYKNGQGSIKYFAPHEGTPIPDVMPNHQDHRLVGPIDFDTMEVVEAQEEVAPPKRIGARIAFLLVKSVMIAFGIAVFIVGMAMVSIFPRDRR